MNKDYRLFFAASCFALATALAGTGSAQAQAVVGAAAVPQTAEVDDSAGRIGDIVVTARRREERLQDTPVAVTALTGAALAQRGVTDITQVAQFAPSVNIGAAARSNGNSTQASIFIRGIGQLDWTLTTEPGVGLYVDGIYVARSVGALLDFVDIDRVEVLRGPQGTLFGKNAVGGAMNIVTRRPGNEFGGSVEATYGRFNRIDMKASVDLPISETLKSRFSIASLNRDGYQDLPLLNGKAGGYKRLAGKGAISWEPSTDFTLDLSADFLRARDDSTASSIVEIGDCVAINPCGPFVATFNAQQRAAGRPEYLASSYIPSSINTSFAGFGNYSNTDVIGTSAIATLKLSPTVTLKSLTGYRTLDAHFALDGDGSPLTVVQTEDLYDQKQFSEELQLAGSAFDNRLNFLVGGYYFRETGNNINLVTFNSGFRDFLFPGVFSDPTFPFQSGGKIRNTTWAGFTQNTLKIAEGLSVTAGLRYSWEKKEFDPDQYAFEARRRGIGLLPQFNGALRWLDPLVPRGSVDQTISDWSPKASVEYKWAPDILTYASYSEGYKSGGFAQRIMPGRNVVVNGVNQPNPVPAFGPEKVAVYEAGFKSTLFDKRLRLNLAAFYTDYSDIQVNFFDGIATRPQNAGDGRIKGFEAEAEATPFDGSRLNAAVSYTDAKLTRLDPGAQGVTLATKLPYVSKWQLSGGASQDLPLADWGRISFRGDVSYRSAYSPDIENAPVLRQRGYTIVNVSATLLPEEERWSLQAGARNLTNKRFIQGGLADPAGLGQTSASFSVGAEWYVTARFRFN
ncbi:MULTISPECIES: TonB-dependent receptor [unclassified Sphingomonas]|uniref:TonB-dependent receptor n=1 Tax=unclassified Sphingomonas TaxID=196159 RepID=UPI0006F23C0D|nr:MULTISPECIES: TonB-dependent receptor [unclassified Sphingomonas]KQX18562.1 hypothetical protein ASD17_15560 [Sphingomonas sp. Root1294]KQY72114.1 hypothetical protein ASD39_19415 [Sphingomonas sp. Root50]KRB94616.1 hypothetical protein ASE22_01340 [Sphingomonas sp. Root720]